MCHVCTSIFTGMSANAEIAEGNRMKGSYLSPVTHSPVKLLCKNVYCLQSYMNTFELKPAIMNSLEALDNLPQFKSIFSNHFTLIRLEVVSILRTLAVTQDYTSPLQSTTHTCNYS